MNFLHSAHGIFLLILHDFLVATSSDGSGPRPARARARSPGSKARPELDFLGPDPSIGDGSGPRPARARPGARGHEPGPGPSF